MAYDISHDDTALFQAERYDGHPEMACPLNPGSDAQRRSAAEGAGCTLHIAHAIAGSALGLQGESPKTHAQHAVCLCCSVEELHLHCWCGAKYSQAEQPPTDNIEATRACCPPPIPGRPAASHFVTLRPRALLALIPMGKKKGGKPKTPEAQLARQQRKRADRAQERSKHLAALPFDYRAPRGFNLAIVAPATREAAGAPLPPQGHLAIVNPSRTAETADADAPRWAAWRLVNAVAVDVQAELLAVLAEEVGAGTRGHTAGGS